MYAQTGGAATWPVGDSIAASLATAGLAVTGNVAVQWDPAHGLSVTLPAGSPIPTLLQQQAQDSYLSSCGWAPDYPMTTTASTNPAAVGSTATITADTGDAAFTGSVEFYVGGALQSTATASGGKATCSVTSPSAGTVTVYAWSPTYGYASVSVTFQ